MLYEYRPRLREPNHPIAPAGAWHKPRNGAAVVRGARLDQLPFIHHIDAVGLADSGEAMGNRDRRPILRNLGERALNRRFGFVIDRRSGFVENENRWVFENGASDRQPLPLPP